MKPSTASGTTKASSFVRRLPRSRALRASILGQRNLFEPVLCLAAATDALIAAVSCANDLELSSPATSLSAGSKRRPDGLAIFVVPQCGEFAIRA
eukprot:CAMPEP_0197656108 /NCGR_PEP_ID=MMETSP1338-20131121/40289_1 /TAXON_ID=43686 ORGANISM="Pelagodinium beii, Strain RCC1491" /NCGR_SAMPLE_ID=MMETSP1338 /ASSEMBLY_ACC=CAM_ASM_000754 /LENGTH=94 /DNA_ID=CAMNT_0043231939 /DNA_START=222 /DNA_END=506 /DNA_ORIENTATION=-